MISYAILYLQPKDVYIQPRYIHLELKDPDFITFLRHYMAHIENQLITSNNWVVLGGASEKYVPL